jgi:peptidoglycan-associated lipoprotein
VEAAPPAAPAVKAEGAMKPAALDLGSMRIQFAFDDSNLSSQAKETLEKIASWMSKDPAAKIRVQGNTCDIGTAEYNLALGDRRAVSAKKYLEGLGIATNRVATISYGKEKPLVPNTKEENRVKNRRDDFVNMK